MSEEEYQEALQIAERKVEKKKNQEIQANLLRQSDLSGSSGSPSVNALSAEAVARVFGRFYQPGDAWDVAVWQYKNEHIPAGKSLDHRNDSSYANGTNLKVQYRGLFHYEILNAPPNASTHILIKISEVPDNKIKSVDPSVAFITLTLDNQFKQIRKAYTFKDSAQSVRVFPDGIRSGMTPLEFLPLDAPDFISADSEKPSASTLPKLPSAITNFMDELGIRLSLTDSTWYEQDDFFGRPIQALWKKSEPWPVLIKNSYGITVLVRKRSL